MPLGQMTSKFFLVLRAESMQDVFFTKFSKNLLIGILRALASSMATLNSSGFLFIIAESKAFWRDTLVWEGNAA